MRGGGGGYGPNSLDCFFCELDFQVLVAMTKQYNLNSVEELLRKPGGTFK